MKTILNTLVLLFAILLISYVISCNFETYFVLSFILSATILLVISFVSKIYILKISTYRFLLITVFLLIVFTPLIGKKETTSFEKRALAAEPILNLQNVWMYFFDLQKYFNDRLAYRNKSVDFISRFKYSVFKTSPTPNIVTIGKDDWLFYTIQNSMDITNTLFAEDELIKIKNNLQIVTKWFALKGIKYYFFVAPIKARIYPEKLNAELLQKFKISKLDQLYNFLKNDTTINVIDVRDELIAGKNIRPTYIKTDTHWNEFGAFLAYEKIIKSVKKDFPNIISNNISQFKIDSFEANEGDLQLMMGFEDEINFTQYKLTNKSGIKPIIIDSSKINNSSTINSIREMPNKINGLKLFVVRDSYTEYLRIFLTPNFDRSFYAWTTTVPVTRVLEEKSDLIIHEILERFILTTLSLPPEIEADTIFLNKYFPNIKNTK